MPVKARRALVLGESQHLKTQARVTDALKKLCSFRLEPLVVPPVTLLQEMPDVQ